MICNNCKRDKGDVVICPYCHVGNVKPFQPHHLPAGSVIGGRYEIYAVLGEGGFGITYLAADRKLDKQLAVKEFFPHGFSYRNTAADSYEVIVSANPDVFEHGMRRFLSEAKTLAKFSGQPGIVNVTDYLEENHTAYLVMEYLEGVTLMDHLKRYGNMKPTDAFERLMPVINALEMIHNSGVIHRDISPDNIMIVRTGEVKLMDFGSAKEYIDSERSMSVLLKTGYAPEEQYRKHSDQGPWTDVYALCATIYRCITGKVPVDALNRLVNDTLQRPSLLGVPILPALEDALMYGLAVRKQDRCQSMGELRRLIDGALRSDPSSSKSAPAADEDVYATVPADENTYLYRQKLQQLKSASSEKQVSQARMKRVSMHSSQSAAGSASSVGASAQKNSSVSSGYSAPKASSDAGGSAAKSTSSSTAKKKASDTEKSKRISLIEAWSAILPLAGLVCAYFVFFKYRTYWSSNFAVWDSVMLVCSAIIVIVLPALVNHYINKPHDEGKEPALIFLLVIATLLCVSLIYSLVSIGKDIDTEKYATDYSSTKIQVTEKDSDAKLFQSTVNNLFSCIDETHYTFSSTYSEDKPYDSVGSYYTTRLAYDGDPAFDLSSSVQVGSMTITINKTTFGDMKAQGWTLDEDDELKTNSYDLQIIKMANGEKTISLGFNATEDDVEKAKITYVRLVGPANYYSVSGEFNYQGITENSTTIQDTVDALGEPSSLYIFHDDIEMEYKSDDSQVKATVTYEYDLSEKKAILKDLLLTYNK